MYRKAYNHVGMMLDAAKSGEKWRVLDNKEQAMRSAHDVFVMKQVEEAHEHAREILKEKGIL